MPEDHREPQIIISPEATEELARLEVKHPGLGESAREMFANMRQAMQAVKDGRYATFDDAIEAITGQRPIRVLDDC